MPNQKNILDENHTLEAHRETIDQKKWLKRLYIDFYRQIKQVKLPRGKMVELGSGAGFIKTIIPQTITSDVIEGKGIDMVFEAEKIPFRNNEVAAFYLLNVLHHIKNAKKAFSEMERCLKPGGKVVMIEPANTWWSRIVYKFHHETFDPQAGWSVGGRGRLSDSNLALPWIVFIRDGKKFVKLFPGLKIVRVEPHTPLLYLFSGGLTWPQILPTAAYPIIKRAERLMNRWRWQLGMFMTIELEK